MLFRTSIFAMSLMSMCTITRNGCVFDPGTPPTGGHFNHNSTPDTLVSDNPITLDDIAALRERSEPKYLVKHGAVQGSFDYEMGDENRGLIGRKLDAYRVRSQQGKMYVEESVKRSWEVVFPGPHPIEWAIAHPQTSERRIKYTDLQSMVAKSGTQLFELHGSIFESPSDEYDQQYYTSVGSTIELSWLIRDPAGDYDMLSLGESGTGSIPMGEAAVLLVPMKDGEVDMSRRAIAIDPTRSTAAAQRIETGSGPSPIVAPEDMPPVDSGVADSPPPPS